MPHSAPLPSMSPPAAHPQPLQRARPRSRPAPRPSSLHRPRPGIRRATGFCLCRVSLMPKGEAAAALQRHCSIYVARGCAGQNSPKRPLEFEAGPIWAAMPSLPQGLPLLAQPPASLPPGPAEQRLERAEEAHPYSLNEIMKHLSAIGITQYHSNHTVSGSNHGTEYPLLNIPC